MQCFRWKYLILFLFIDPCFTSLFFCTVEFLLLPLLQNTVVSSEWSSRKAACEGRFKHNHMCNSPTSDSHWQDVQRLHAVEQQNLPSGSKRLHLQRVSLWKRHPAAIKLSCWKNLPPGLHLSFLSSGFSLVHQQRLWLVLKQQQRENRVCGKSTSRRVQWWNVRNHQSSCGFFYSGCCTSMEGKTTCGY